MKQVTYYCNNCGNTFTMTYDNFHKIDTSIQCVKCFKNAVRTFNNISISKEEENVSAAIQTMMFSKNPSGKSKTVI